MRAIGWKLKNHNVAVLPILNFVSFDESELPIPSNAETMAVFQEFQEHSVL
jgi:hypothetical protein